MTSDERRRLIEAPITFNIISPTHGTSQATSLSSAHDGYAVRIYLPGRGWTCEDNGVCRQALRHGVDA